MYLKMIHLFILTTTGGEGLTSGAAGGRSRCAGHSQKRSQRGASGSEASSASTRLSDSPKLCAPLHAVVRPRSAAEYRASQAREAVRPSTGLPPEGVTLQRPRGEIYISS